MFAPLTHDVVRDKNVYQGADEDKEGSECIIHVSIPKEVTK